MFDVRAYLESKGLALKEAGPTDVHTACVFCGEDSSKRGRLYINVDPNADPPGLFFCHLCSERGAINKLRKHFGDPPLTEGGEDVAPSSKREILNAAAEYYHTLLADHEKVYDYLHDQRGLSLETIQKHQLGWADGSLHIHLKSLGFSREQMVETGLVKPTNGRDFFQDRITIPYHVMNDVVGIRGKQIGGKYFSVAGDKNRLFNVDAAWGASQVILTEGEFDAMVVEQLGYAACGVPGANQWQDGWSNYLEKASKVFIVFDNDAPGELGAEKVAKSVGAKARIVRMPSPSPDELAVDPKAKNDPTEWLVTKRHSKDEFAALLRASKGGQLLSVREGYAEWLEMQTYEGLKFGIRGLDSRIKPGLLPSQVMVVLAKTGTGKQEPVDSLLPTPNGYRRIGDLRPGDFVFGKSGEPTLVTGVFPQGVSPTYRVSFKDGSSLLVGGEHLWEIEFRYGKKREWRKKVMSTVEILNSGLRSGRGWKYQIPMCSPVQYDDRSFAIDPYTMGSIIANGYTSGSSVVVATPDREVWDRVRGAHKISDCTWGNQCPRFIVVGVMDEIRRLGLNVKSGEKFIPPEYLRGSVKQRMELLRGLMDGDGTGSSEGRSCVRYSTTSSRLANDVRELVASLGGTAVKSVSGRKGYLEFTVTIMVRFNPFGTSRKGRGVTKYSTVPRRPIVSIERVDDMDSVCISVAASDSLYLSGRDYIVTHNTIFTLNLFKRILMHHTSAKILFVSLEQTRGEWFERARRLHRFYAPTDNDLDCLPFYEDRMMIVDKNRLTEDDFVACIDEFEYEMGEKPTLVAVDYLGYWARAYGGEPYERTSKAIMSLKAIAKDLRIAILTPHQVSRGSKFGEELEADASRDSGVVEETADFMLGLWAEDNRAGIKEDEKTGRITLKIMKSRHGGAGTKVSLQFAPLSLAMIPIGDDPILEARARAEFDMAVRNDSFDTAIYRHATGDTRTSIHPDEIEKWKRDNGFYG